MTRTRIARRTMVGGLAAALGLALAGPVAAGDDYLHGARRFVAGLAGEAEAILEATRDDPQARATALRRLLRDKFAIPDIGRWVLGRYWRAASPRQRAEYLALFENLILTTYLSRLESYSDQTVAVTGAVPAGGSQVVVRSRIEQGGGRPPIRLDWRVRAGAGHWRVVDVMVEGVSLGQTRRSDFAAMIRRHGGAMEPFLDDLRGKVRGLVGVGRDGTAGGDDKREMG